MPAKTILPTNAKMTAFVCSGRMRPKARWGSTFAGHQAICSAASAPTSIPTMPQMTDAKTNPRVTSSLYSTRVVTARGLGWEVRASAIDVIGLVLVQWLEREAVGVLEIVLSTREDEEKERSQN